MLVAMDITFETLALHLIQHVPIFDDVYKRHQDVDRGGYWTRKGDDWVRGDDGRDQSADSSNKGLPPLIAKLFCFGVELAHAADVEPSAAAILQRIIAFLECAAQSPDDHVRIVITRNYLAHLDSAGPYAHSISAHFGPTLIALWDSAQRFRVTTHERLAAKGLLREAEANGPYICPVCGWQGLEQEPYNAKGRGSFETCACCGFEYGWTDHDQGWTFAEYRDFWIKRGMPWWWPPGCPPKGWEPHEQLHRVQAGLR